MSCSNSTIGRLRRDGPDDHAVAGRRRTPHHRRARGDRRSAPRPPATPPRPSRTSQLSSPPGGRRGCRWSMSADNRPRSASALAPAVPPLDGEIVIVRNASKRLRRRRPRSQARRTRGDDAGPLRDARDPCARSVGAARGRPWLSGLCRRRRVPGGRHGRSQRPALAGGGRAGAVAGASQGRDRDHRRCRDGASSRGDGQGAPAARGGKGLTTRISSRSGYRRSDWRELPGTRAQVYAIERFQGLDCAFAQLFPLRRFSSQRPRSNQRPRSEAPRRGPEERLLASWTTLREAIVRIAPQGEVFALETRCHASCKPIGPFPLRRRGGQKRRKRNAYFAMRNETFRIGGPKLLISLGALNQ